MLCLFFPHSIETIGPAVHAKTTGSAFLPELNLNFLRFPAKPLIFPSGGVGDSGVLLVARRRIKILKNRAVRNGRPPGYQEIG
jgi:hypothetical protein